MQEEQRGGPNNAIHNHGYDFHTTMRNIACRPIPSQAHSLKKQQFTTTESFLCVGLVQSQKVLAITFSWQKERK